MQYSHSWTSLMKLFLLLVAGALCFIKTGISRAFLTRGIFRKPVCTRETTFVATQYVTIVYKYGEMR